MTGAQKKLPPWGRISSAALRDKRLSHAAKTVLGLIAIHANEKGLSWPSQRLLADHAGIEERQIKKHIRQLKLFGYIDADRSITTRAGHRGNLYTLRFPAAPEGLGSSEDPYSALYQGSSEDPVNAGEADGQTCLDRESAVIEASSQGLREAPSPLPDAVEQGSFEGHPGVVGGSIQGSPDNPLNRVLTESLRTESGAARSKSRPAGRSNGDPYQAIVRRVMKLGRLNEVEIGLWLCEDKNADALLAAQTAGTLTTVQLLAALRAAGIDDHTGRPEKPRGTRILPDWQADQDLISVARQKGLDPSEEVAAVGEVLSGGLTSDQVWPENVREEAGITSLHSDNVGPLMDGDFVMAPQP